MKVEIPHMKKNHSIARWQAIGVAMAALALPTPAYAEGADASILVPKAAEFFPALIAFIIIWVIMAKYAWPKIIDALDAREKKIQDDVNEAEAAKVKAAQTQEELEHRLAEAQRQSDEIIAEAKRAAEQSRNEILAKAQSDAAGIIARAHESVENERRVAANELRNSVADLSVEMTAKIIGEKVDEEGQRKLIEKYLAEVGDFNE